MVHPQLLIATGQAVLSVQSDTYRVVSATPNAAGLLGLPDQNLVGANFLALIHPDQQPTLLTLLRQSALQHSITDDFIPAIDESRMLRLTSMPDPDVPNQLLLLLQDITAQYQHEWRLTGVLNALPDTIVVQTLDGTYTEIHHSRVATPGIPDVAAIGRSIHEMALPDEVVAQIITFLQRAHETDTIQTFEYALLVDGEYHFYETRMVALNHEEVMSLIRDVTAFKRIQEELSRHIEDLTLLRQIEGEISDNINIDHVLELTLDAALRLANATAGFIALHNEGETDVAKMIGGYNPDQIQRVFAQSSSLLAQVVFDQRPRLIQEAQSAPGYVELLSGTREVILIPLVYQERLLGLLNLESRVDGRFTRETFQFLRLLTGRIAAMLDNANLYRKTRHQLLEMQSLYNRVSKLEQLKTDMIRIASHDLRSPLTSMKGFLDILHADLAAHLTDKHRQYFTFIEESIRQMQQLVSGILSLERIEQMMDQRAHSVFDLVALVREVFDKYQPLAHRKEQVMALMIQHQPLPIEGDIYQMREAVANLIQNAIKYTPERGSITILLEKQQDMAVYRVQDTGYGIPAAQQKNLFKPFFRAKSKETRNIEGAGLGLHLVKNIVERANGQMIFESEQGKGSVFGFQLPLSAKVLADEKQTRQ